MTRPQNFLLDIFTINHPAHNYISDGIKEICWLFTQSDMAVSLLNFRISEICQRDALISVCAGERSSQRTRNAEVRRSPVTYSAHGWLSWHVTFSIFKFQFPVSKTFPKFSHEKFRGHARILPDWHIGDSKDELFFGSPCHPRMHIPWTSGCYVRKDVRSFNIFSHFLNRVMWM